MKLIYEEREHDEFEVFINTGTERIEVTEQFADIVYKALNKASLMFKKDGKWYCAMMKEWKGEFPYKGE